MKLRSRQIVSQKEQKFVSKKVLKKTEVLQKVKVVLERLTTEQLNECLSSKSKQVLRLSKENEKLIRRHRLMEDINRQELQEALNASLPELESEGEVEREQQQQPTNHVNSGIEPHAQLNLNVIPNHRRKKMELCARPEPLKLDGCLAENWKRFKRLVEIYLTANECDTKPEAVKIALFKNLLGDSALDVFCSLNLTPNQLNNYAECVNAMEAFCKPRKNTVFERHNFYKRNQQEGESFDSFLMEIRRLVKTCDFGDKENEMLRDKIVMGVVDIRLQAKLLETNDLTYDIAIEKCRANEATKEQTREMNKTTTTVNEIQNSKSQSQTHGNANNNNNNGQQRSKRNYTNHTNRNNNSQNQYNKGKNNNYQNRQNDNRQQNTNNSDACKYCNLRHAPNNCPAYGKNCNLCSKRNHFASVCFDNNKKEKKVETINAVDFDNEFFCHSIESFARPNKIDVLKNEVYKQTVRKQIVHIDSVNSGKPIWREDIRVNGKFVAFKVDSGSDVNVIPRHLLDKIAPNIQLGKSDTVLKAFGGGIIEPIGICKLNCTFKNHGKIIYNSIDFEVVDVETVPLLGLIGAIKFKLVDIRRIANLRRKNASSHFL